MTKKLLGAAGLVTGAAATAWLLRPGRHGIDLRAARDNTVPGGAPTALITGASSGIGAEFARQLAARGFDLVLVARRRERLEALALEIATAHGVQVEVFPADLAHAAGVTQVVERIGALENLAVLVNNAGFGTGGRLIHAEPARQEEMVYLHVMATMRLTQAALPGMLARRHGVIVNVSSVAAYIRMTGATNYSATKSYINAFSEGLQKELTGTGIVVQALAPGLTHSEFHDTPEYQRSNLRRYPAFMWMTASEVVQRSLAAVGNGAVVFIPGAVNRAIAAVVRAPIMGGLIMRRLP
jgi:hypothetical protein